MPIYDDVTTFDGTEHQCDLLSGGFPCQPFSVSGKRLGDGDERFLWDEMLRIACESKSKWILGENVHGLLTIDGGRAFGRIIDDLDAAGYRMGWACFGAGALGGGHLRTRVFLVAYSDEFGRYDSRQGYDPIRLTDIVPSSDLWAWSCEPTILRGNHGVPNRVDRLRALGNAVVPQQVYPILKAIADSIQSEVMV